MTSNKDRVAETKRKIIVASRKVLKEQGRDRFNTGDVAAAAGVSIGTVYRYYEDRIAILKEVDPDGDQAPKRIRDAVAYIDKTMDNVVVRERHLPDGEIELDVETAWDNEEVLDLLADIRETLISGGIGTEHRVSWTELVNPR